MDDQKRARRLSSMGYDHLRSGAWFEAVKIGHALRLLRHPAGYELCALGLAGMGEVADAALALEEGVQVAPGSAELWDLLGVYRAENGDLRGALAAFDEALLCPEPDEELVHLHAALALRAAGCSGEALARLELCAREGAAAGRESRRARCEALRAGLLHDLDRPAEAEAVAAAALEQLCAGELPADSALRASLAELESALAVAAWQARGDRAAAVAHARAALALDATNGAALVALRRLLAGRVEPAAGALPVSARRRGAGA